MKKIAKKTLLWILMASITMIVMLAILELGAIGYLTARDGKFIAAPTRFERPRNTFVEELRASGTKCTYVDTLFPHPYQAFVHHRNPPCGVAHVNNIGLFGADFPSEKPADRFVILLTGGSVASMFGGAWFRPPPARNYLEEELNRHYASPDGKSFLVLNGADGAWKQPQQLVIFLQYADVLDAVVTLDGFNEHLQLQASTRFEHPANSFLLVNPLATRSFGQVVVMWIGGQLRSSIESSAILRQSHAAYLVSSALENATRPKDADAGPHGTSVGSIFGLPADWPQARRSEWGLGQYRKYMLAMDAVARQRSVHFAHFVQPVPAYGKQLTEAEKAVVGNLGYRDSYLAMTRSLLELNAQGSRVISLLDMLQSVPGTIYGDPIHMLRSEDGESQGNALMAQVIAQHLAVAWGLQRK